MRQTLSLFLGVRSGHETITLLVLCKDCLSGLLVGANLRTINKLLIVHVSRSYFDGMLGLMVGVTVEYASDSVGWREVEGGGVSRRWVEAANGDSVSNGKLVEEGWSSGGRERERER